MEMMEYGTAHNNIIIGNSRTSRLTDSLSESTEQGEVVIATSSND